MVAAFVTGLWLEVSVACFTDGNEDHDITSSYTQICSSLLLDVGDLKGARL